MMIFGSCQARRDVILRVVRFLRILTDFCCVDTIAIMDPRIPLRGLRMNGSAGRLIVSDANDEMESLCLAWMKAHYEHLRGNPLDCARDGCGREWRMVGGPNGVTLCQWKLGEVTLEINVLPVLHTKGISETRRPSSLHVLLHRIVHTVSFTRVLQR